MNAADLQHARQALNAMGSGAREVVKSELASRIRTTGLESTLRWLNSGGQNGPAKQEVARSLCATLNIPLASGERGHRTNLELLDDGRRALALAEALHYLSRT